MHIDADAVGIRRMQGQPDLATHAEWQDLRRFARHQWCAQAQQADEITERRAVLADRGKNHESLRGGPVRS